MLGTSSECRLSVLRGLLILPDTRQAYFRDTILYDFLILVKITRVKTYGCVGEIYNGLITLPERANVGFFVRRLD